MVAAMSRTTKKGRDPAIILLALAFLTAVVLLCSAAGSHQYGIWADRDLARADVAWNHLPVTGTEMNGTFQTRTPGGGYYALLHLMLAAGQGPDAVRVGMIGLLLAGTLAAAWEAYRLWGWRAALVAATLPLISPTFIKHFRILWNPSVAMALDALIVAGMLAMIRGRRRGPYLFALSLALSIQVHLSALALGAAALAATALCARNGARRHYAAAALLGLSLFLPYLLREGSEGLRLVLATPGGDGGAPSPIRWDQAAQLMLMILGSPETVTNPLVPEPWLRIGRITAEFWAAGIALAMASRLPCAAVRVFRPRDSSAAERGAEAVAITLFLTLALLIGSLGGRFSLDGPRYAIPLIWPMALGAGWAADRVMRRFAPAPAAVISAWLAAGALASRVAVPDESWDNPTRRAVLAVAETTVPPDQIRRRVVMPGPDGQARQTYAEFWLRRMPPPREEDDGACVAVMPGADAPMAEAAFARLAARAAGGPAAVRWRRPLGDGWAIGYDLPHGNCWRSVDSPYVLYPVEDAAERTCRSAAADGIAVPVAGEANHFAVRLTHERARFCLSLSIGRSPDGGTAVELNSAQLRGYSGYPSQYYALVRPRIELSEASGGVAAEQPLVDGSLGSIDLPMVRSGDHDANPTRPPWRTTLPVDVETVAGVRLTGSLEGRQRFHPVDVKISLRPPPPAGNSP